MDLSKLPQEFVVFHVKTTGLDPDTDEIIEFGAIRINRDAGEHRGFREFVKAEAKVPPIVTRKTGITQDMVDRDGVPLSEALGDFVELTGDLPVVVFYADFDMAFLFRAVEKCGFDLDIVRRYVSVLELARRAYPGLGSYHLADLIRMGRDTETDTRRAIGACMGTAKLFIAVADKLGDGIEWEVLPETWRIESEVSQITGRPDCRLRRTAPRWH